MSILIFTLVVLIVLGLCLYAIDLVPMDTRLRTAAKVIAIVIAIILLLDRAGGL